MDFCPRLHNRSETTIFGSPSVRFSCQKEALRVTESLRLNPFLCSGRGVGQTDPMPPETEQWISASLTSVTQGRDDLCVLLQLLTDGREQGNGPVY